MGHLGSPAWGEGSEGTGLFRGPVPAGVGEGPHTRRSKERVGEGTSYLPQTPASQPLAASCPKAARSRQCRPPAGLGTGAQNRAPGLPAGLHLTEGQAPCPSCHRRGAGSKVWSMVTAR